MEDNAAKDLRNQARKTGERIANQGQQLESNIVDASQRAVKVAGEYVDEARQTVSDYLDTSVEYVKKNPARSVLGAALVGYLIGFVSRRRS